MPARSSSAGLHSVTQGPHGMAKPHTIFVRLSKPALTLEWQPSSEEAGITELLRLLEERGHTANGELLDVVEETTGLPVHPESAVASLRGRTLLVRDGFIAKALAELEGLRSQVPELLDFELLPGSSAIMLDLRLPGLVQRSALGRRQVSIRARHRALAILPSSFPLDPPRLLWLTPIFHPNLAANQEVWPPGVRWEPSSTIATLVASLGETLAGLRVATKGPFGFRANNVLSSEASSWFRRHGKAVKSFALGAMYPVRDRYEAFPLVSSDSDWRLVGPVTGGAPMVFLSRSSADALNGILDDGPGWLIGKRGERGVSSWFYVDRAVPCYPDAVAPASAIGAFGAGVEGRNRAWRGPGPPLTLQAQGGAAVFRLEGRAEITGYFTLRDGPADSTPMAPIRVTSGGASWTSKEESRIMDESTTEPSMQGERPYGVFSQRALEPPLCAYCDAACRSDEEWGVCAECDTVAHTDCSQQLGGCPNTGCPRSPLYIR